MSLYNTYTLTALRVEIWNKHVGIIDNRSVGQLNPLVRSGYFIVKGVEIYIISSKETEKKNANERRDYMTVTGNRQLKTVS